jgi:hypothetical protein
VDTLAWVTHEAVVAAFKDCLPYCTCGATVAQSDPVTGEVVGKGHCGGVLEFVPGGEPRVNLLAWQDVGGQLPGPAGDKSLQAAKRCLQRGIPPGMPFDMLEGPARCPLCGMSGYFRFGPLVPVDDELATGVAARLGKPVAEVGEALRAQHDRLRALGMTQV